MAATAAPGAAATADASDGEQIELEDSLITYIESHADATPADLLRAFNVRSYLWPRLTSDERDAGAVVPDSRVADCSQEIRRCRVGMGLAVSNEGVL